MEQQAHLPTLWTSEEESWHSLTGAVLWRVKAAQLCSVGVWAGAGAGAGTLPGPRSSAPSGVGGVYGAVHTHSLIVGSRSPGTMEMSPRLWPGLLPRLLSLPPDTWGFSRQSGFFGDRRKRERKWTGSQGAGLGQRLLMETWSHVAAPSFMLSAESQCLPRARNSL